ncbi:MAG: hypothetical protein WCV43_07250 [Candidatus Caldatribacteriota bacterium]|nr:hypothetical protein [Atribacterota bacterium]MDD4764633.1 hypothetical protein [Atribacterota bacterium]MDI9596159.1 hypothetical protein [Atribacterota bacterium]
MDKRIQYAFENSKILKWPKQLLSSFGSSEIHYHVLTEPVYQEFTKGDTETVVREGTVSWHRPQLLTPGYILRIEGFSDEARNAFSELADEMPDLASILYRFHFKREVDSMNFVSGNLETVADKIARDIEKRGDNLSAIIQGVGDLWDISLSKFILDMMTKSARQSHFPELRKRGLVSYNQFGQQVVSRDNQGIPLIAKKEIESMFQMVKNGDMEPRDLKKELDRWGLFELYQDRFFDLFRRR